MVQRKYYGEEFSILQGGMRVGSRIDYSRHRFPKVAKQHLWRLKGGSNLLYYIIILPSLPYGSRF